MTPNKKVAFYTFGCKLNFSESSAIGRQFEEAGYAKVPFDEQADVYIINTCSVTENADKKCKKLVQSLNRQFSDAKIVITGCYAQLKPKEILDIKGVSLVIGAQEKFNIPEHLEKHSTVTSIQGRIKDVKTFYPSYSLGDRTRSFLKVQDGCDYFCSFCTIPLARGTSRNASIQETVKTAEEIAQKGIKEIVLTGVNIGDFGKTTNESFLDLIRALDQVVNIDRFRISSIEPNLLSNEIISFCASSKKFVPHFHIPLQSGSDEMLKSMRRRYDTTLYIDRIKTIKKLIPDCCIGVDVIVGYPGETEELFLKTYHFLEGLDISYLHVFPYSEREKTTAIRIEEIVPPKIRNERRKKLQLLSHKKKKAFYESFIGETREVLFEKENKEGFMYGFTENYLRVKSTYNKHLTDSLTKVNLNALKAMEFEAVI